MSSGERNGRQRSASSAYFLDSYAVIEILDENPEYAQYARCAAVLTKLNLFEIFQACLRKWDAETAQRCMHAWAEHAHECPLHVIAAAACMREQHKRSRLSMADCIGYCFAEHLGIPFLTGDNAFEGMENVEFVR